MMKAIATIALMLLAFGSEGQQNPIVDTLPNAVLVSPDGGVYVGEISGGEWVVWRKVANVGPNDAASAYDHLMSVQRGSLTLSPGYIERGYSIATAPKAAGPDLMLPEHGNYLGSVNDLNDFDWAVNAVCKGDFYRVVGRDLDLLYNGKNWEVIPVGSPVKSANWKQGLVKID